MVHMPDGLSSFQEVWTQMPKWGNEAEVKSIIEEHQFKRLASWQPGMLLPEARSLDETTEKLFHEPPKDASIRYGVYAQRGPYVGMTVSELRRHFKEIWRVPSDAIAFMGMEKLPDTHIIHAGETIEFHRAMRFLGRCDEYPDVSELCLNCGHKTHHGLCGWEIREEETQKRFEAQQKAEAAIAKFQHDRRFQQKEVYQIGSSNPTQVSPTPSSPLYQPTRPDPGRIEGKAYRPNRSLHAFKKWLYTPGMWRRYTYKLLDKVGEYKNA